MAFTPGHRKVGGRRVGAQNRFTGAAREVAYRLLADPEYQQSLVKRLRRGVAPRLELHLWELAFGRPRVESEEAPTGVGASEGLVQLLEKLGEPTTKTQNPASHRSASPGTDEPDIPDIEAELRG
jgi:hypothetical protein